MAKPMSQSAPLFPGAQSCSDAAICGNIAQGAPRHLCPLAKGKPRADRLCPRMNHRPTSRSADRRPPTRRTAQRPAGAVQPWRRISGCTDRSAGGCADRRTLLTIRARAAAARCGAGGRGLEDRSPVWKGARAPCYACAETRPCEAQRDRVPDAPSADGTGCLTRIRLEG